MTERDEIVDQLAATVRRFAREQLIPAEQEVEETDDIPERIIRQIKELGLFGMTIPESYDGLALLSYLSTVITAGLFTALAGVCRGLTLVLTDTRASCQVLRRDWLKPG